MDSAFLPNPGHGGASILESARVARQDLPEFAPITGGWSVRSADLTLLQEAPAGALDTTHFDTVRFPPPPWALECFTAAADHGENAYTGHRGNERVLASVAETVAGFLGVPIDPAANLLLTPGSQAALFACLASLVDHGTPVTLFDPDYLYFLRMLRFFGADLGWVPIVADDVGRASPDLDALEHEFSRRGSRLLVFSHPNNPSGAVYPEATLAEIARLAVHYDVFVIVDELYARLLHDGAPFSHFAAMPGMAGRTATILGPSKTESLSGYRLGMAVGPADLMRNAESVLSIMALRAPAIAQHVLVRWLRDDGPWLAERLRVYTALRAMTVERLTCLPWLKLTPGHGTAYVWPDVSALGIPGLDVARALLRDAGVFVSPGYQFGPSSGGHFRMCYARDETIWSDALDRIVSVLERLGVESGLSRIT